MPQPNSRATPREILLTDPAQEIIWARLPQATATEVKTTVKRAVNFFTEQAKNGPSYDRLALLERLIAEITARQDAFASAISREMGAPLEFARSKQVEAALAHLRVIRQAAETPSSQPLTSDPAHMIRYEPLGVAALITPWNWPLNQIALKAGAALVAGCAMIHKPSELSLPSALLLAECFEAAGAPTGLYQLLLGDGEVGAELVAYAGRGVDVISFTGSTPIGRQIAAIAGQALIPCHLELGGKSPNILFEDCDLALAIRQGLAHCYRNSGQSCNAASRMLVAEEIYDQAVELARVEAETYRFGAPNTPGDHLGPLVSAAQYDRVQSHIARAIDQGARLITGGLGRADGFAQGYYPRPTVFADVTPDMDLFTQEVFGPVLAMTPFTDEAQAIALANTGPYGLAGYIQSANPDRLARVSAQLEVGMVQINGNSREDGAPFGGRKASGFGREAGLWGIRSFQAVKSVSGLL